MIEPRYRQQTLYEQAVESFMPDHKKLLWEGWMLKVDELLEKDQLVEIVHRALQQRHPQSGTRGRKATPAEVVLRLLVLKHLKNWSYETLEKEVRPNLGEARRKATTVCQSSMQCGSQAGYRRR
jgi:hypothetical protein